MNFNHFYKQIFPKNTKKILDEFSRKSQKRKKKAQD